MHLSVLGRFINKQELRIVRVFKIVKREAVPLGMRLVSIFFLIQAYLSLAMGVVWVVRSETLFSVWTSVLPRMGSLFYEVLGGWFSLFSIGVWLSAQIYLSVPGFGDATFSTLEGISFLLLGMFLIFVVRGLLRGGKWAHVGSVIFAAVGVVASVFFFPGSRLTAGLVLSGMGVIINLCVLCYLLCHRALRLKGVFSVTSRRRNLGSRLR